MHPRKIHSWRVEATDKKLESCIFCMREIALWSSRVCYELGGSWKIFANVSSVTLFERWFWASNWRMPAATTDRRGSCACATRCLYQQPSFWRPWWSISSTNKQANACMRRAGVKLLVHGSTRTHRGHMSYASISLFFITASEMRLLLLDQIQSWIAILRWKLAHLSRWGGGRISVQFSLFIARIRHCMEVCVLKSRLYHSYCV